MTIHKSAKIYKDVILVETSLEDNTFVTCIPELCNESGYKP